ncbi:MAG: tetratricopeptide repeat protein [Opitutae bacterium]|nr:tetratricopeptide repeat protein [Opitutae bacterium]
MSPAPPSVSLVIRRAVLWAGAGLVATVFAAYHNSFSGPFVFDDIPAIVDNASLRDLGRPGEVLWPQNPGGLTTSGRPVVNLTLALNHALSGEVVWSYHAFNLLIHTLAGLMLFGLVRRTLFSPALRERWSADAVPWAALSALLWAVHPLQTESVTYVVQRTEALMGLFYLLTLYTFVRGVGASRPARWFGLSVLACALGMATKEVMVSAPLLVLLYDRTFVAGSFGGAWRQRRGYYLGLAGTWALLVLLVAGNASRGGTAGFDTVVTPGQYLLTQCGAIVRYLQLAVWPHPLVFDYGTAAVAVPGEVWWQVLLLLALLAGTAWALVRKPVWGFLGAWFFAILAPSSSFVPVASQTMAEHRMYLPLAVPVILVMAGLRAGLERRGFLPALVLAGGCVVLTMNRNLDYASELSLWTDTVAKRPANSRAHNNLGLAEFKRGHVAAAIVHYEEAVRRGPQFSEPPYNLGLALASLQRYPEAIARYEQALALRPDYPEAHNNLGNALLATGRPAEALRHYEAAVRTNPAFAEAHSNLANLLLESGRPAEALRHGEEALQLDPGLADAHYNTGNACAALGRFAEALAHYEQALRLRPDYAAAHNNAGNALLELDRPAEAIAHYEQALQLLPDYLEPRRTLGLLLAHFGRFAEARPHLEAAARALPGDEEIIAALERAKVGR